MFARSLYGAKHPRVARRARTPPGPVLESGKCAGWQLLCACIPGLSPSAQALDLRGAVVTTSIPLQGPEQKPSSSIGSLPPAWVRPMKVAGTHTGKVQFHCALSGKTTPFAHFWEHNCRRRPCADADCQAQLRRCHEKTCFASIVIASRSRGSSIVKLRAASLDMKGIYSSGHRPRRRAL